MAQNPFPFGSIDYDNWNYEHPQERSQQADPVWQARQQLESLGMNVDTGEDRNTEPVQAPSKPKGALRGLTENASSFGGMLGLAAAPGIVPSPYSPIAGVLGVGSSMAMAPDYIRRSIPALREEGEEMPGLMETAMTVGPAALSGGKAALRGLRGLIPTRGIAVAPIAEDIAGLLGGQARAYEGAKAPLRGGVVDPMQKLALASRQAPTSPIEQLMETPAFARLPKGSVSKAKAPKAPAGKPESVFQRMQREGQFQGDRTTGQFEEGPGGLSSLAGRSPVRGSSSASIMNDMEGDWGHGLRPSPWRELGIPNPEPLSDMERLAARSAERFGRRFRRE